MKYNLQHWKREPRVFIDKLGETKVAEGKTKMVLFFKDPSSSHAHEPDINMLIRICDVHNVPLATNEATAQMLLNALLLEE